MPTLIAILVFAIFAAELIRLLRRADDSFAIAVLFGTLGTVMVGELINLSVTGATSYPGCATFPLYIVLGGGLVGLWLFRAARHLARATGHDNPFTRMGLGLALTLPFPLAEMAGITLGLWTWRLPCHFLSPGWLLGIWFFYTMFLAGPALLLLLVGSRPTLSTPLPKGTNNSN